MKNIIKITFIASAVAVALLMSNCKPQEFDDYSLDKVVSISADQVTFKMTKVDEWNYDYSIEFAVSSSKFPFSYEIRFGEGNVSKTATGKFEYIVLKGEYIAQCLVYTPDGNVVIKEQKIVIGDDNQKLFNDDPESLQFALTGGKANIEGKQWTLGPWTGMRNPDNRDEVWWDYNGPEPAMMNDVMIFKPNSVNPNGGYKYENNGDTFCNESLENSFPDGAGSSFVTQFYNPPTDATWDITVEDGKTYLTIHKGFVSYAVSPGDLNETKYEVVSFSPSSIKLIYASGWNGWCFELISKVIEDPLTGLGSKTWVIDGYNKHKDEAKTESGKNIQGFMGLGPLNSYGQEWWGAGPGDKSFEKSGWTLYDWKITFTAGKALKIETKGEGYGRKAFNGEGFNSTSIDGDDMTFDYSGGDYTYTLDKSATPYPKLTLSGNAFLGYYCGTQEYEIVALTKTVMAVAVHNTKEGQDWVLVFTPEGEQ